ncbi:MAG: sensor histidine kinase [Chitinophagaceae bacterium]|nr:sensor histidine kinase [Chitinophagaceae bacterium]
MRKIALLIYVLLPVIWADAQTIAGQADSLLKRLNIINSYDDKIELLGKISDVYSYADSVKAIHYALQIKKLAEEKNDQRGVGMAYYRLGGAYLEVGNLEKAEKNYMKAEEMLEKDTSRLAQEILARTWSNHGLVYQRKGDGDTHLRFLLEKTIPINEKLKDSTKLGINYNNIGIVFQNIREYGKAIVYFKKSVEMLKHTIWVPELKDNYVKIAESMIYVNVDEKMKDSVYSLLNKAEGLIRKYPDVISEIMYLQAKGMTMEYFDGNLNAADEYYAKALEVTERNNVRTLKTSLLLRRYYIKELQGQYKEALAITKKIYFEYNDFLTPNDKLLQLNHMMTMEENLGDIKAALDLHKKYIQLSDSIQANNVSVKVQDLEKKYEAKEKETQIIKLNQVAQAQQLQIQKNRQWMYLLGSAIVLLTGFFIARQMIARNRNKIAMQEAELLQQRIGKMKQEQHISHFAAVLEGQEQERKRLAIDLHDGLGGSLSGIRLKLSKMIQDDEMQSATQHKNGSLKHIAGELDRSINDLRHIARNMMPESLLKYGLTEAIKDFCRSMGSENVEITFQSYDVAENLAQSTQIMIFRILQELITNAVKHAKAKHILAQCLQQGKTFSITVEDDGKGFEVANDFEGIGLTTLKSRVKFLDGKLDIHSEKEVGTTINIEFDIKDEQQN